MSDRNFVHLHCHSHYSLLDGASPIGKLVQRAKDHGMNALALTDHGNLHGALEFYRKAKEAEINPIIGYEAYIAPGSRFCPECGATQQKAAPVCKACNAPLNEGAKFCPACGAAQ